MTDYSEKVTQKSLSLFGGATAIVFGLLTSAHLQVLTPLVNSLSTFLSTSFAFGPFSLSYALLISLFLALTAKGASNTFGDIQNDSLDIEFIGIVVITILLATPSVTSWAAGGAAGLLISSFSVFLYAQVSRDSGLLSGTANMIGEVRS